MPPEAWDTTCGAPIPYCAKPSNGTWRVSHAAWYAKPAPRRFFALSFNERVDFAREDRRWTQALYDDTALKRPLLPEGAGATRCRTFHAKLNDGAVGFMNKHINEWTDGNPAVVLKYATATIGIWEGKKADPHLILTVFY